MNSVILHRDLVYSNAGGKPRLADLYLPESSSNPSPVILWLHGGGWRFGDRNLAPDLTQWFAQRGFAMVSIDYRLSDEAKFPAPVIDVKAAVRWVRSIATQYELDPEAIGLWGSSAGGHLAACAALAQDQFVSSEHAEFSSDVRAVVAGYCATDFARMDADRISTPPRIQDAESVLVKLTVPTAHVESFESRLIGVAVGEGGEAVTRANPVTYTHPDAPPFLLLHGESDALVPWTQSRFLYDALTEAGNDVTLVTYERLGHGFFNNSDLDATELGEATIFSSDSATPRTSREVKVFALCEAFFHAMLSTSKERFRVL